MITVLILLAIVIVFALWAVGIYNGLVTARNAYKNAFAQIDVQLQRRFDLIPNLVETAKGYLEHERGTLEAVTAARNAAQAGLAAAKASPGDPAAMAERSEEHTSELQSLMRISYAVLCLQTNKQNRLDTAPLPRLTDSN